MKLTLKTRRGAVPSPKPKLQLKKKNALEADHTKLIIKPTWPQYQYSPPLAAAVAQVNADSIPYDRKGVIKARFRFDAYLKHEQRKHEAKLAFEKRKRAEAAERLRLALEAQRKRKPVFKKKGKPVLRLKSRPVDGGTLTPPRLKLKKRTEGSRLSLRSKRKAENSAGPTYRGLWFRPESESYVEVLNIEEARKIARECVDVTGDAVHELAFKRETTARAIQAEKQQAKQRGKPKLNLKKRK